jgi:putative Holliday junction resolvase
VQAGFGHPRLLERHHLTPLNEQNSVRENGTITAGRLLALDLGARRVGVAVCDELRMTVRPLAVIQRTNWKALLNRVREQIGAFNAAALVIGLPLNLDGSEGDAAQQAREMAEKFRLSIGLPVYLQDERLTTEEARSRLAREQGRVGETGEIDSHAAAIILQDFLSQEQP